jgi:hypothetical protein
MPGPLDDQLMTYYYGLGNNPGQRMVQSDVNRNPLTARPGFSSGLTVPQEALVDRYAWGADVGLGGLPAVAATEAVKWAEQQTPWLSKVTNPVSQALGFGDALNPNASNSSPASWKNVAAYYQGATDPVQSTGSAPSTRSAHGQDQTETVNVYPSQEQQEEEKRRNRQAEEDQKFFDQYSAANPNPVPQTPGSGYIPGQPGEIGIEEWLKMMLD